MILGVEVASNRCTLFCLAKLTCLFLLAFYSPIESGTKAVGYIAAALGEPDGWLAMLCMGRSDCHTLCIVVVALGNGSAFVLGVSDAVVEEQIVTFS